MSDSIPPGGYPQPGHPQPGQPQPGQPQPGQPQPGQPQPGQPPGQGQPIVPPQQPNPPAPSGGGKPLLFGGIGVVVGLLIGVLAGSMLFGGGGSGTGEAADDAATACAYVDASVDQVNEETMTLDQPLIWQLQAAGSLAQAAAVGDASYQTLGEQGLELFGAMSRLDVELAQSTLAAMEQTCQDL